MVLHMEKQLVFISRLMPHAYLVHGLILESDFPLPELERRATVPGLPSDIMISEGAIGPYEAVPTGVPYLQLAGDAAILDFGNAGRFLVRHGREVIVEAPRQTDRSLLRLYLFGSVMGLICHQRGLVGLHASAVEINGRAAGFTGEPGAGKSTLAAHCLAAGSRLVADDLLVLSFRQERGVVGHAGMPNVKLWRDALKLLGHDPANLQPDWWRADKFHVPVGDVDGPVRLARLYVLEGDPMAGDGEAELLRGREAARVLIANTFRVEYLDAAKRRDTHFQDCMRLASAVEVVRFRRAIDPALLPATAAQIVADLRRANDRSPA